MSNLSNTGTSPLDLMMYARDTRNSVFSNLLGKLFRAPETVVAKCYLEPRERTAAERIRPTNDLAVNPLMMRGLHIS